MPQLGERVTETITVPNAKLRKALEDVEENALAAYADLLAARDVSVDEVDVDDEFVARRTDKGWEIEVTGTYVGTAT